MSNNRTDGTSDEASTQFGGQAQPQRPGQSEPERPSLVIDEEPVHFSRTPGRDIFGKLDARVPEVRVPHQVLLDAECKAHELGLDLTAFLRLNLYASLYGPSHVASLHEKQLTRVLGNAVQGEMGSLRVYDTPPRTAA